MKHDICSKRVIVFGALVALGCSADNVTDPVVLPECSDIESITVATGPELSFSWSPACRLMGWNIEPAGSADDQWLVLSEGSNSIAPPITYGVVPEGAREIHEAEVLAPGAEYDLHLFKWTGPGAQDGLLIKSASFTR